MLTYFKKSYTPNTPFLSIITRRYNRPKGLAKNLQSITEQSDYDLEQIFITDDTGHGLHRANKAFSDDETRELVTGKYVFLLDDDDFIKDPEFISLLKGAADTDPDVIFFRMNIIGGPNGDVYPTPETWMKEPKIAHIGGSCFVVSKEVYDNFIHHFDHPRCADFYFIKAVMDSGVRSVWLNAAPLVETGSIGRGRPE